MQNTGIRITEGIKKELISPHITMNPTPRHIFMQWTTAYSVNLLKGKSL